MRVEIKVTERIQLNMGRKQNRLGNVDYVAAGGPPSLTVEAAFFENFHLLLGLESEGGDAVYPVLGTRHEAAEEWNVWRTVACQGGAQQTGGHGVGLA